MADFRDPLLDGALYVTFVRSTLAHGTFTVDTTEAAGAPGVHAVFTSADLDVGPMPPAIFMLNQQMLRPVLASGRVRFVGEPVAAVVTDRPEQGVDAAELVIVDYEPLTVLVDPEEAATSDVLLFEEAGTNSAFELMVGHSDDFFDGCEAAVSQRVVNPRVNAAPLEVRGVAAAWDGNGKLNLWLSTQGVHGEREALATIFGLEHDMIRVATPDVGGGFGAKMGVSAEDVFVAWAARRLGRPVRWHESRSENMVGMVHGRAQVQTVEIGGKRDGTVEAYRLTIVQDSGAYPAIGAILPFLTRMMSAGVYDIPKIECNASSVVTNTTPVGAYRGAGRPEAAAAIERAMDLFASEIGMDPVEVRRKNLRPRFEQPVTTVVGTQYDTGDYAAALDLALASAGYEDLRAEQKRRRDANDPIAMGIGVSIYVEVTAGPTAGGEHARIEVHPDGTATAFTGTSPHGQGHETTFAMIVQDTTGIPMDKVNLVWGDTDLVARGQGTGGSRSLQLGGSAILRASEQAVDEARNLAAELLEASPDDVVLDTTSGQFHVTGTPAVACSWAEIATAAAERGDRAASAVSWTSKPSRRHSHSAVMSRSSTSTPRPDTSSSPAW